MKQTILILLLFCSVKAFCQDSSIRFTNNIDKSVIRKLSKDFRKYQGITLPNFTVEDTSGNKISLSSQKNNILLLHFWYTHCAPCLAEMPYYQNVLKYYKDSSNITFISICVDRGINKTLWKSQIVKYKLTDTQLFLDTDKAIAPNNKFYRQIDAFPTYLISNTKYRSLGCVGGPDNDIGFIYSLERAKAGIVTVQAFNEQMNLTQDFQQWAKMYLLSKEEN